MTDYTRRIQRIDSLLLELDNTRYRIEQRRARLVAMQRGSERNARHVQHVLRRLDRGEYVAQRGPHRQWLDAAGAWLGKPSADDMQALQELARAGVVEANTYTSEDMTA